MGKQKKKNNTYVFETLYNKELREILNKVDTYYKTYGRTIVGESL